MTIKEIDVKLEMCKATPAGLWLFGIYQSSFMLFAHEAYKGYPQALRELKEAVAEAEDWKQRYVNSQRQWEKDEKSEHLTRVIRGLGL